MITTDTEKTVRIGWVTVLFYTLNELVITRSYKHDSLIAVIVGASLYYGLREWWVICLTCLLVAIGFLTEVRVTINMEGTISKDFYFLNRQIVNLFALTILSGYQIEVEDYSNSDTEFYVVKYGFDNTSYSLLRFEKKRNAERVRKMIVAFLEVKLT
jgi:hypothetical protein